MNLIRFAAALPILAVVACPAWMDRASAQDGLDLPLDVQSSTMTPVAVASEPITDPVVEHLTNQQWVEMDVDGTVVGRVIATTGGDIVGIADAEVTLISGDNDALMATTDGDGRFEVYGATAGIYAITARAEGHFGCCAMHIVDPTMPAADEIVSEALISTAAVDFTDVQTALIRYLPPVFNPIDRQVEDADLRALKPYLLSDDNLKVRQRNGGVDGFIIRPGAMRATLLGAENHNVFLFRDGIEVGRTLTRADGHFRFDGIEIGDYSLIAVGADGVGSAGFELVAQTAASTVSVRGTDGTVLTQTVANPCCNAFAMQIAPPTETVGAVQGNVISDTVISEQIIGETILGAPIGGPVAGGFVPGAGFGGGGIAGGGLAGGGGFAGGGLGGGGGLFGGGIGRLATLGGLAAAIAIAASDDDDNVVPAPAVASPDMPTTTTTTTTASGDDDDDDDSDG